jgi:6-phosphofructokinase 2
LATHAGEAFPPWSTPDALDPLTTWLRGHLHQWARQAIIITLGAGGALLVTEEVAHYVPAPSVQVVSAAGAGDAVAAGVMLARWQGQSWADALCLGVAAAAAVVMNEGTAVCTAQDVYTLLPQVRVAE